MREAIWPIDPVPLPQRPSLGRDRHTSSARLKQRLSRMGGGGSFLKRPGLNGNFSYSCGKPGLAMPAYDWKGQCLKPIWSQI